MSEHPRKFLPSEWLDEMNPSAQADANAFVRRLPNGEFWLGAAGDEWDDYECFRVELTDGDIINFSALETYDDITLTVSEDDFTTFPPNIVRANCFRLEEGDYDDVWNNLSELIDNSGETGGRLADGSYQVECWWWSDEDFPFRFTIDADGNGRLDPCAGASS
ncbi:hypothetical protein GOZ83_19560 [Agrobacterium vitis]|uniref:hypothetical protein n=1 Tax=Agrobacterium vitis TaxID=373 RepID=UPI0012E9711B|nr:hypothetical protein [Agrobacterium vitis]MVA47255.1 hypothetical protein [Agrobacterium vitis]